KIEGLSVVIVPGLHSAGAEEGRKIGLDISPGNQHPQNQEGDHSCNQVSPHFLKLSQHILLAEHCNCQKQNGSADSGSKAIIVGIENKPSRRNSKYQRIVQPGVFIHLGLFQNFPNQHRCDHKQSRCHSSEKSCRISCGQGSCNCSV